MLAPGLSLTGLRLVVADRALGLPVFRALSLCTCCRHYPGAASGRITSLISSRRSSLPRKGCRVGLRIVLFEACSAFTRVAACTLALPPIRDTLIEGFSHFVASMTAPIASGWSGCRVGLAPTGKRRLVTAHTQGGHRTADRSRFILPALRPCVTCVADQADGTWAAVFVMLASSTKLRVASQMAMPVRIRHTGTSKDTDPWSPLARNVAVISLAPAACMALRA
jgi:hypothetical protein